jgi:hypothetical protein
MCGSCMLHFLGEPLENELCNTQFWVDEVSCRVFAQTTKVSVDATQYFTWATPLLDVLAWCTAPLYLGKSRKSSGARARALPPLFRLPLSAGWATSCSPAALSLAVQEVQAGDELLASYGTARRKRAHSVRAHVVCVVQVRPTSLHSGCLQRSESECEQHAPLKIGRLSGVDTEPLVGMGAKSVELWQRHPQADKPPADIDFSQAAKREQVKVETRITELCEPTGGVNSPGQSLKSRRAAGVKGRQSLRDHGRAVASSCNVTESLAGASSLAAAAAASTGSAGVAPPRTPYGTVDMLASSQVAPLFVYIADGYSNAVVAGVLGSRRKSLNRAAEDLDRDQSARVLGSSLAHLDKQERKRVARSSTQLHYHNRHALVGLVGSCCLPLRACVRRSLRHQRAVAWRISSEDASSIGALGVRSCVLRERRLAGWHASTQDQTTRRVTRQ